MKLNQGFHLKSVDYFLFGSTNKCTLKKMNWFDSRQKYNYHV